MFVALRDLRFARGRFILIGSVVLLITLLVGFLGGLTQGLANANISALTPFHADRVVLAQPGMGKTLSFIDSQLSEESATAWSAAPGVTAVEPLGITISKVTAAHDREATVSLFGVEKTFTSISPEQTVPTQDGTLVLSKRAQAALHANPGDPVTVFGHEFTVAAVSGSAEFSHTGVIWMSLTDWRDIVAQQTVKAAPFATALAVQADSSGDFTALDARANTTSSPLLLSLMAIESFKSEIGSLGMMLGLLLGISALVIGAFFTVWTIQRSGDIAVLKALGASTASLVRDALGQALVVLVIGVGLGIGITAATGAMLPAAVPFVVSPVTTILPAVAMVGLGLIGAAFALRSVIKTDPLTALNGQNN
ncbi:ABC transporter permease [Arthrobacter sp. PsM3]|uniref:ABC transporter permease n=1 Tax=Arthrobacter sp. PsM3 TaxID=3030531 RepID=UPI00263B644F|nr:ABC transporter permease [Arthrobacter sp. PsM3]MDN4642817.1 ABC transporter permease [Arthrobacter sp. PsM3]